MGQPWASALGQPYGRSWTLWDSPAMTSVCLSVVWRGGVGDGKWWGRGWPLPRETAKREILISLRKLPAYQHVSASPNRGHVQSAPGTMPTPFSLLLPRSAWLNGMGGITCSVIREHGMHHYTLHTHTVYLSINCKWPVDYDRLIPLSPIFPLMTLPPSLSFSLSCSLVLSYLYAVPLSLSPSPSAGRMMTPAVISGSRIPHMQLRNVSCNLHSWLKFTHWQPSAS